jgi:alkylation response protein AidB-like acyl-CoA dehydrogenase
VSRIRSTFEHVVRVEAAQLPLPGEGDTWARFEALSKWATQDLSLGRLVEGHVDAVAILAEAGMKPAEPGATYGVWAARSSRGGTTARLESDGWHLTGTKPFCSGSGLLERALVTADTADGYRLFDIDVTQQVIAVHPDSWQAVGMADSQSETLDFGGPAVPLHDAVGGPGFYLERPGFWSGAIGVAACWYGGAAGSAEHLGCTLDLHSSELVLADFGHAVAHVASMRHVLKDAAAEIDADPTDKRGRARERAQVARHAVHHGVLRVLEHVAAAGGARPLCHDREQGQRAADLYVYLAQHHGAPDAKELGRSALAGWTWN